MLKLRDVSLFCVIVLMLTIMWVPVALADTNVVVPWGDWTANTIDFLLPTVLTVLSGVVTYIIGTYAPAYLKAIAGAALQKKVNEVLEKAVLSAVAQTKGAVLGKRLTIPLGYDVLQRAAQYAVDIAPDVVRKVSQDSADNLFKMILARMEQWGVAPEQFDISKVQSPAQKKKDKDFDFQKEIARQLGK